MPLTQWFRPPRLPLTVLLCLMLEVWVMENFLPKPAAAPGAKAE